MSDPILAYVFPFKESETATGNWDRSLDFTVWSEVRAHDEPPLTLWELVGQGQVRRVPEKHDLMHIIHAGTYFHLEHIFGYWRRSDADTIFFRTVQPEGVYYALVLGGMTAIYEKDAIAWVCPQCGTLMCEAEARTGQQGQGLFNAFEKERVAYFNSDPAARICPKCATPHPYAYRFPRADDSPEEAAARKQW